MNNEIHESPEEIDARVKFGMIIGQAIEDMGIQEEQRKNRYRRKIPTRRSYNKEYDY